MMNHDEANNGQTAVYQKPVIDSHVHVFNAMDAIEYLPQLFDYSGFKAINVLSLTGASLEGGNRLGLAQNASCLLTKASFPENIYSFGGLYHTTKEQPDYVGQVEKMIKLGFDGIKMIEGKPSVRKNLKEPLDAKKFDSYYECVQEKGLPIIFHAADPDEFWDVENATEDMKKSEWFYGNDPSCPSKQHIYDEISGILRKHPNLKIVFAHFYFLSNNIERAKKFLETWPNVYIDITPCPGAYVHFSRRRNEWRDFFTKYQDRIIYGTDNICTKDQVQVTKTNIKINSIKTFLETDLAFEAWHKDQKNAGILEGIGLGADAIEKICYKNFRSLLGYEKPRAIHFSEALGECEYLHYLIREYIENMEKANHWQNYVSTIEEQFEKLQNEVLQPGK